MPVLSPADLFLGQGMHVFKDVCNSMPRTSHVLEFYRHVLTRWHDDAFWRDLRSLTAGDRRASIGLGVVTCLLTSVMGDFAPDALTSWTVNELPGPIRLWVETYGRRVVFGKSPGSKLYLLLQSELESAGIVQRRSIKAALLPSRLPPAIIRPVPNETLSFRFSRYRLQGWFICSRLRFHLVEGLRYAWEAYRWRRRLKHASLRIAASRASR
jgi:hypothetical protein